MFQDIGYGLLDICHDLLRAASYHTLAKAVSAVHGAAVRGKHQYRLRILMLESLQFCIGTFAAGVECAGKIHFQEGGNAHLPDRVIGIIWIDKGQIVTWNGHRIFVQHF